MNADERRERIRVLRETIAQGWNGVGDKSKELREHAGLAQHQIAVGFDTAPSAGVLVVEGRPVGSTFFVAVNTTLASIDVATTGACAFIFAGFFDAIRVRFSTALTGATQVEVVLHSGEGLLG